MSPPGRPKSEYRSAQHEGASMSLELDGVTIAVAGRRLVGPLSLQVGAGEVLAVMGPSGCGKSSLLAYIAGMLEPPLQGRGRVVIGGRDVGGLAVEHRHVGLLFQDDLLFPHMSVLANLLFALPAGVRRDGNRIGDRDLDRAQLACTALAGAGLAGIEGRLPAQLSGGQRARVSLLRALLAEPQVLLLDEPFSRLDAKLRAHMRSFTWSALRQRGVPALLVTHDEADAPPGAQIVHLAGDGAA